MAKYCIIQSLKLRTPNVGKSVAWPSQLLPFLPLNNGSKTNWHCMPITCPWRHTASDIMGRVRFIPELQSNMTFSKEPTICQLSPQITSEIISSREVWLGYRPEWCHIRPTWSVVMNPTPTLDGQGVKPDPPRDTRAEDGGHGKILVNLPLLPYFGIFRPYMNVVSRRRLCRGTFMSWILIIQQFESERAAKITLSSRVAFAYAHVCRYYRDILWLCGILPFACPFHDLGPSGTLASFWEARPESPSHVTRRLDRSVERRLQPEDEARQQRTQEKCRIFLIYFFNLNCYWHWWMLRQIHYSYPPVYISSVYTVKWLNATWYYSC
jgi:hypothetical protein